MGLKHCIPLREWFDYRGHVCMSFQKLGPSLYEAMRVNSYRPFCFRTLQNFALQLIEAVQFMHELKVRPPPSPSFMQPLELSSYAPIRGVLIRLSHPMRIVLMSYKLSLILFSPFSPQMVHTDLKPENILLTHPLDPKKDKAAAPSSTAAEPAPQSASTSSRIPPADSIR